jgi:ribosome-associated toxin RatA of RatAB toxin-antitoxin module
LENVTYEVKMSRHLNNSPDKAYEVMEHLERLPEFLPSVNSLTVLEEEGTRKVAAWDTTIDDAPFCWVEEGIYDREHRVVHFRALEGVFDRFDGYWRVEAEGDGSRVTFELTYEIGLPEIEEIIGPILRERMVENAESMLEAIEKWVDET